MSLTGPTTGPAKPTARVPGTLSASDARWGALLSLPTLVVLVVLVLLPTVWTISLAFQHVTLLNIRSTGVLGDFTLSNIRSVLSQPGFVSSLTATLVYSVFGTLLSVAMGLGAALCLRKRFKGRFLLRGIMLIPYVAPVVAATYVWQVMLNPTFGFVNQVGTTLLGWQHSVPFLSEQHGHVALAGASFAVPTALITVIVFDAWRYFPFAFLFYTARLQGLSLDLEEAARVDGATLSQRFRYIVNPQLRNVTVLLIILRFVWTFNKFDDVYLLTGGSAGTQVVSIRVYQFLTAYGNVGTASAQALVLAIMLGVIATVYAVVQSRSDRQARPA